MKIFKLLPDYSMRSKKKNIEEEATHLRVRDVEESELALLAVQHDENGLLAGHV